MITWMTMGTHPTMTGKKERERAGKEVFGRQEKSREPIHTGQETAAQRITRRTVARGERGRPCDLQKAFSVPWRGQCPPQGPSSSFPTVPSSRPALGPQGYRSSSVSVANYAVLKTKIMLYLSCILSNPLKLPLNVKVNCWFTTADL